MFGCAWPKHCFKCVYKASSCTSGTLSVWLCVTEFSKTSPFALEWIIALQSFIVHLKDVDCTPSRTNQNLLFWKTIHFFPSWVRPSILIYTEVTWRKFQNLSCNGLLSWLLLHGQSHYQATTFLKLSIQKYKKSKGHVDLHRQVFTQDRADARCRVSKQYKIHFPRSENDDVIK